MSSMRNFATGKQSEHLNFAVPGRPWLVEKEVGGNQLPLKRRTNQNSFG